MRAAAGLLDLVAQVADALDGALPLGDRFLRARVELRLGGPQGRGQVFPAGPVFCPTDLRKSSEANSARSIGLMSVAALVNSAASLAISCGRGVSDTKCRANAVAIVLAVAGWWAR